MKTFKLTLAVTTTVLATACATQNTPSNEDFSQGWRRAQVLEIGNEQLSVRSEKQDCRPTLSNNTDFDRFAITSYSFGGSPNLRTKRIVAIPKHITVKPGDWVLVNIRDCKKSLKQID